MALDFSLGISWQFGLLAVFSMLVFPFFRGRYAFVAGALCFSLVDFAPAILAGHSVGEMAFALFDANSKFSVGLWTLFGILTWGAVAFIFSRERAGYSPFSFVKMGVIGTLVFDAVTGVILSPIVWGMPFSDALIGQIPFTAKHLLGMMMVSMLVAPLIFPTVNKRIGMLKFAFMKPQVALG
jgi:hypothetical protein